MHLLKHVLSAATQVVGGVDKKEVVGCILLHLNRLVFIPLHMLFNAECIQRIISVERCLDDLC